LQHCSKVFVETHLMQDGIPSMGSVKNYLLSFGFGTEIKQDAGGSSWIIANRRGRMFN
jgi:hypothetical protein